MLSGGDNFSAQMIFIWGVAIVVLGLVMTYGAKKSGWITRRERRHLDENTRAAQSREDPS